MFLYVLGSPSSCRSDRYLSAAGAKIGVEFSSWNESRSSFERKLNQQKEAANVIGPVAIIFSCDMYFDVPQIHDNMMIRGVQKEYTHSRPNSFMNAAMRRYEDVCSIVILLHRWH